MNRKIKYLFFSVIFITMNVAISIIVVLSFIVISELVLNKFPTDFIDRSLVYILALLFGTLISIFLYIRLYRYAEEKWYIDRIFNFSQKNSLDL